MTDKLRAIGKRLASGIIPRGAAHDVAMAADEIDQLATSRDALIRHVDALDAEIVALKIQLAPPFDLTAILDSIPVESSSFGEPK